MRSIYHFLFAWGALLLGLTLPAQAQRAVWQQSQLGGYTGVGSQIIATDSAGNTYVSGAFYDSLRLPGRTVRILTPGPTSIYNYDVYVAKYGPTGHLLWVTPGGGAYSEQPYSLVVDHRAGAVYTTGEAGEGFRLGTTVLDSGGVYLARFNATTGAVEWARRVGPKPRRLSPANPVPLVQSLGIISLAVAPDHSLYLGGIASGNLSGITRPLDSLDLVPLVNANTPRESGFVAHCTPAGVITNVFELVGGASGVGGVKIGPTGELAVTGWLQGRVQFGQAAGAPALTSTNPVSSAGFDAFLLRMTPSGPVQWVKPVTSSIPQGQLWSVAFDAQGNIYSTGSSRGVVTVDQTVAADSGQHVFKFGPQGNLLWLKTFPGNEANNYARSLLIAPDGLLYSTGIFYNIYATGPATYGTFTLPPFGITNLFVLCQDPATGDVRWAKTRDQINGNGSNNIGYTIQADAQSNLFVFGYNDSPGTYDGNEVGRNATFLLKLEPSAFLSGQVYLDANANGQRDPAEGAFPRPVMVHEGQRAEVYSTGPTGYFNAFVQPGPFALSVAGVPAYYALRAPATGTHRGTLTNNGQRLTNLDFGLAPIPDQQDLRVSLTPYSRARPGQVIKYRARVENVGTTTIASGQVRVTLDSLTTFIGTIPTATPAGPHTWTWAFQNLAPFATRDYDVVFTIPVTTPLNTPLHSVATVTPLTGDLNPADNTDVRRQVVSNSADPNQITVNYPQLTPQQVAAGQPIDYTIEFENLGNDTAYAVLIQDTLPAGLLQLGTMRLVSQSHNCQWLISGRLLKVTFPNIVLPHQAVDALRSKGFARFRVTPNTTLGVGTLIPNTAHITFDFNLPVATNQATTLVQSPNGLVAEPGAEDARMQLYPNPATEIVTLTTADAGAAVTLFDALGRPVRQWPVAPNAAGARPLDVRELAPGLYLIRVGTRTQQLVVK